MLTRWLTVSLVAIALGVAALEVSASLAEKPRAARNASALTPFTDAGGSGLPTGAESESTEVSALPRFTE